MTDDIVLANARLVLETEVVTGSLHLSGGEIRAMDQGAQVPRGALDCAGDLVVPGLVELHTDNLERHLEPRPGVDWRHDAGILAHDAELAGCGITTVFDALRVGNLTSDSVYSETPYARGVATEILAMRAAGHLKISHHIHLRAELCSHTLPEELEAFHAEDRVGLLSLMDHTPGDRQFTDLGRYRQYMTKHHKMTDAEFETHCRQLQALSAERRERHLAAALSATARLGATLASHDDTTVAHVDESRAQGVGVAEFPTTHAAAEACRAHGIAVMMGAPNIVRGGSHSGNVSAAMLAREGLLDILSSDYIPAALLLATMQLAEITGDLPGAFACVTSGPARAVGLTDRGALAPGLRADVVRLHSVGAIARPAAVWCAGNRVA